MKQEIQLNQQVLQEEEVIRKARKNPQAFRELYEKYYKTIFLFVLHRAGDRDLTADITSQVFLKALMQLPKYEFRGLPFSSWLYRIAINECYSYFRKNKRERTVILEDHHADNLYEEMFGESTLDDVKAKLPFVLERLKPEELQLIELRYLENRAFREVAEIIGITETYAKVRTYRILDKMKKIFIHKIR